MFLLQDFLGLVEKLHYLSGIYTLDLIVGDDTMVSSILTRYPDSDVESRSGVRVLKLKAVCRMEGSEHSGPDVFIFCDPSIELSKVN